MQSRKESLLEAIVDGVLGFLLSVCIAFVVNKVHGIEIPMWKNFTMTACFTGVSLIRRYLVRRFFNKREQTAR